MNFKTKSVLIIVCFLGALAVWYFQTCTSLRECNKTNHLDELRSRMRLVWDEHVTYSRSMFSSILDDKENKDTVIAQLMKNQNDIGDTLKPYYGNVIGDEFAALLREHIRIAVKLVQDAKDNKSKQSSQDKADWIANADQTAQFLSEINPYWSFEDLQNRFREHLVSAQSELQARLKKEWTHDPNVHDQGRDDMQELADVLVEGIAKQFPDKL